MAITSEGHVLVTWWQKDASCLGREHYAWRYLNSKSLGKDDWQVEVVFQTFRTL